MAGFWYRAGTVSVTNASKKVVGSGTLFKTTTFKPDKGHAFYGPDGKVYEIDYVESDTVLYLVKAYTGATASGQPYEIDITRTSTIPALSREISAQLAYAQGQYDSWQQILTGSGNVNLFAPDGQSVTVPALSNMLSKSGNLAGLADKAIARANLGAYKQGDATGQDLNNVTATGEYQIGGNEAHWAFPGTAGHMYVHDISGGAYVTQIAVSGAGMIAIRCSTPGGWPTQWDKIIRQTDVQGTLTDANAGKVMRVGAFGLGNVGVMPRIFDANSIQANGWYEYNRDSGDINGPEPYGTVLYTGNPSNGLNYQGWHFQIFFTIYGDMYLRHSALNTFAGMTWRRVWSELSFPITSGIWTPYFDNGSVIVTNASWQKVGNTCTFKCHINLTSFSGAGSIIRLKGLPFAALGGYSAASVYDSSFLAGVSDPERTMGVVGLINGNAVEFFRMTSSGGRAAVDESLIRPQTNGTIVLNVSGTYVTQ